MVQDSDGFSDEWRDAWNGRDSGGAVLYGVWRYPTVSTPVSDCVPLQRCSWLLHFCVLCDYRVSDPPNTLLVLLKCVCVVSTHMHCRFGKHYELPLLLQSIVMILVMLAMLHICTFVSKKKSSLVVKRITGTPPPCMLYHLTSL